MRSLTKVFSLALILIVGLSACNLPGNPATALPPIEPVIMESPVVPTAPPATDTLQPIPTEAASPVPAATEIVISITASGGNINVRRGPSVGYNSLAAFKNGQSAISSARSEDAKWLYIPIPDVDGQFGWVSATTQFSSISGDILLLPVMTVPPFEPAYIRNCTFHEMLIKPVDVKIPDQTASSKNKVQFFPGVYEVFDTVETSNKPLQTIELREGKTIDITKDGLDNLYTCP